MNVGPYWHFVCVPDRRLGLGRGMSSQSALVMHLVLRVKSTIHAKWWMTQMLQTNSSITIELLYCISFYTYYRWLRHETAFILAGLLPSQPSLQPFLTHNAILFWRCIRKLHLLLLTRLNASFLLRSIVASSQLCVEPSRSAPAQGRWPQCGSVNRTRRGGDPRTVFLSEDEKKVCSAL